MTFASQLITVGLGQLDLKKSLPLPLQSLISVPVIPRPLAPPILKHSSVRLPPETWSHIFSFLKQDTPPPSEPAGWKKLHQHDLTVVMRVNSLFHDLAGALLYDSITVANPAQLFFGFTHSKYKNSNHLKVDPNKRRSKTSLLSDVWELELVDLLAHDDGDPSYSNLICQSAKQYEDALCLLQILPQDSPVMPSLLVVVVRRPERWDHHPPPTCTSKLPQCTSRADLVMDFLVELVGKSPLVDFCSHHNERPLFTLELFKTNPSRRLATGPVPDYSFHINRLTQFCNIPRASGCTISIHLEPDYSPFRDIVFDFGNGEHVTAVMTGCDRAVEWTCDVASAITQRIPEALNHDDDDKRRMIATINVMGETIHQVYGISVSIAVGRETRTMMVVPGGGGRILQDMENSNSNEAEGRIDTRSSAETEEEAENKQLFDTVKIYGRCTSKSMQVFKAAARLIKQSN